MLRKKDSEAVRLARVRQLWLTRTPTRQGRASHRRWTGSSLCSRTPRQAERGERSEGVRENCKIVVLAATLPITRTNQGRKPLDRKSSHTEIKGVNVMGFSCAFAGRRR
jgi:hypothetical protein